MGAKGHQQATAAVHGGIDVDPVTHATTPNVVMSVTFAQRPGEVRFSASDNPDITAQPYFYSRWLNPTVRQLELRLAALEGAGDALATASGMAAIAALFFGTLKAGDHLIVSDVCYAGTRELASEILPEFGILVSPVNLSDLGAVQRELRGNTKLIHAETPCNPLLRLTDVAALAKLAHDHGARLSVDSTLATPIGLQAVGLGADFVVHSLTKFINGHGDALGGVLLGAKADIERIRVRCGVHLGASLSAHSAWLILRGCDSLVPRMAMSARTAHEVAAYLEAHAAVRAVMYPGLPSHPQHRLAAEQMQCFGGVLTFQTDDPDRIAAAMPHRLKLIKYAVSLGHQRSNVFLLKTHELQTSTYHLLGKQLDDYRSFAGEGIFRLSIGLEAANDLIEDLDAALS